MDLPFSFRQKTKIALFLFSIMSCIMMIRLLEDKNIKNMGTAFSSIYNDRLIPAADLFELSQDFYARQHVLEHYLAAPIDPRGKEFMLKKAADFDLRTDSLLQKYSRTFLVDSEKGKLEILKQNIALVKRQLLDFIHNSDKQNSEVRNAHYQQQINPLFQKIIFNIGELTRIQTKVGADLINESQELINGTKIYSTLQFILAIIIGILIISILLTTNLIRVKAANIHLN